MVRTEALKILLSNFQTLMADYIYYYNNERIQAKTKWMPPYIIYAVYGTIVMEKTSVDAPSSPRFAVKTRPIFAAFSGGLSVHST